MSSDEYSEDVPGEEDLYGTIGGDCGDATSSVVPDPRTGSGTNVRSSYRSMNSNAMVMDSTMNVGMFGDNSNQNIMVEGPFDNNNSQQQPHDSSSRQQKRKYVRRKVPDERKRRGPRAKDLNAPRMPLNGYVRFLNANRERLKQENPDLTFAEVTKKLASEWSSMNPDDKKIYLDEAEKEKEIYLKQLHEYQRSDAYQEFMEMKQRAKQEQQQQQQQQSSQNLLNNQNNSIMSPYAQQQPSARQQSLRQQQLPKSYLSDHHQSQQSSSHQNNPAQHSGQSYHHHVPNPSQPSQYSHQSTSSSTYPSGQYSSIGGNRYSSLSQANHSSGSNSSASNPYSHSLLQQQHHHQQQQYYDAPNSNSHIRPLPSASGGGAQHFGLQSGISSPSSSYRNSRSLQKPVSQPVSVAQSSQQLNLSQPPENHHHQESSYMAANYSSMCTSSSQEQQPIFNSIEPYRHRRFGIEPQVVHNQQSTINDLNPDRMVDGGANGSKNYITLHNIKPNAMVDVHIFTDEFLEHNKLREQELRHLRSMTMDYEEANAISSKHIDDLIKTNEMLEADNGKERETNDKLKTILDQLQNTLVEHLGRHVPFIPEELVTSDDDDGGGQISCKGPINLENLDQYFETLEKVGKNISNLTNLDGLEKERNEFVGSIRSAIASMDEVVIE